jgi:membrane-bound lytic murein transglycosylase F
MTKSSDRYNRLIEWYSGLNHVPFQLVKQQIWAESSFNPDAISECGARGLMQLMPATAAEYDVKEIELWNPEINIRTGIQHLRKMYNIFAAEQGIERWKFAVAAYNAGQGSIIKTQKLAEQDNQATDRWDVIKDYLKSVTGERNAGDTINYVARIFNGLTEQDLII